MKHSGKKPTNDWKRSTRRRRVVRRTIAKNATVTIRNTSYRKNWHGEGVWHSADQRMHGLLETKDG